MATDCDAERGLHETQRQQHNNAIIDLKRQANSHGSAIFAPHVDWNVVADTTLWLSGGEENEMKRLSMLYSRTACLPMRN